MAQNHAQRKAPGPSRGSELLTEWRGSRSAAEACVLLKINEAALYAFQAGRARPGLKVAGRIQEGTDGVVYATSWLEPAKTQPPTTETTQAA